MYSKWFRSFRFRSPNLTLHIAVSLCDYSIGITEFCMLYTIRVT